MLLKDMVGKNPGGSPKMADLASISEVPHDVPGEFSFNPVLTTRLTLYL